MFLLMVDANQGWIDLMEMDHGDRVIFCELVSHRKAKETEALQGIGK